MQALMVLFMTSLLFAGCSVVGKRTTAEPPYTLIEKDGEREVRLYGDMIVAETVVEGRYSKTSGPAFSRLAGYIFGKNRGKQKIAMTAPVIQEPLSEKIPHDSSGIAGKKGNGMVNDVCNA